MFKPASFTFFLIVAAGAFPAEPTCSVSGVLPEGSTFVGYTRPGESTLRSFATLLEGGSFQTYDGHSLSSDLPLHGSLVDSQVAIQAINPYLNRMGKDHCVYPASLSRKPVSSWEIWSSSVALSARIRPPTTQELANFQNYAMSCVVQGDHPESVEPTCPKLIAVSDLNTDGLLEYWHTVPYRWDTGLRAASEGLDRRLVPLLSVCPGCSD